MLDIERLDPTRYRHIPWKNGRGELLIIARDGADTWEGMGVAWHFGRTSIVENGPFSDLSGYERLQTVIKGSGLVLVTASGEIDLRTPLRPQRYDGGTPIVTRLEAGPVEVVNLIADRRKFAIDLRVGDTSAPLPCRAGVHLVYAASGPARVTIDGTAFELEEDHALRWRTDSGCTVTTTSGSPLIASIMPVSG